MGWLLSVTFVLALVFLIVMGFPSPQGSSHGQPQAGSSQSTPPPGIVPGIIVGGSGGGGVGGIRRTYGGMREWRRADPTLINSLWKSKMGNGIRKQLDFTVKNSSGGDSFLRQTGNAEVYIMLALLIGLVTVVIGCWLSDNCWSPEPEEPAVLSVT